MAEQIGIVWGIFLIKNNSLRLGVGHTGASLNKLSMLAGGTTFSPRNFVCERSGPSRGRREFDVSHRPVTKPALYLDLENVILG